MSKSEAGIRYDLDGSRRSDLAGQTVSQGQFNVTYDSGGYATSFTNTAHPALTGTAAGIRAPSIDVYSGGARAAGTALDRGYLSNAQLSAISRLRQQAAAGLISAREANAQANDIRSLYGYGSSDGLVRTAPVATYTGNPAFAAADSPAAALLTRNLPALPSAARSYAAPVRSAGVNDLVSEYANLYNSENSAYEQALAAQKAANDAAVEQAVGRLESQKDETNRSYADYARQAYVDRMNTERDIAQRMAAQGVTGGAAESTLLELDTAYSDALRRSEQARLSAVGSLDRAISDARLTGDVTNAQAAADAIREQTASYASVLRDLIDRYDSLSARQQAYDREDELLAYNRWYQQQRDALSDARYADETAYERQRAQDLLDRQDAAAARSNAYDQAWRLLELGIVPGGELLQTAGIDPDSAERIAAQARAEAAASASRPQLTAAQARDAYQRGVRTEQVVSAYRYYFG